MMGWPPPLVYECTVGEFNAAFSGWKQFHAAPEGEPPTRMQMVEMMRACPDGE